uniref:uncharacterized protein LOC114678648 n=1 Tax=Macaca mulatta TaxID=9544 RepID=UPI0010A21B01|nr:uncharacterized protein LOC114678648 [Macaca mulatta]
MGKAAGVDGPCAWGAWGAGRQQARASLTERTPAAGPALRGAGQGHTGVLTLPGQRDGVVGKRQQASFRRDAQLRRRLLTSLTYSRVGAQEANQHCTLDFSQRTKALPSAFSDQPWSGWPGETWEVALLVLQTVALQLSRWRGHSSLMLDEDTDAWKLTPNLES